MRDRPCGTEVIMLTCWPVALQSYNFTVEHMPGKLHVIPDSLSRVFKFEADEIASALM